MPTFPTEDSPFMASRVGAALGVKRDPYSPSLAGKPTPQAADLSYPSPPAPPAAPVGRPPNTPQPTPGSAQFGQWGQGAATPITPPAGAGQAATPSASPQTAAADAAVAAAPGLDANTYRAQIVRLRDSLGPIPRVFRQPNMPELPVEPGRWNYNPFTGLMLKG